ncbi:hypothetical protein [Pseudomonas denitrificans (nom. rej.)]|uniref:hypothetical protein n=1 Tax=Pseudomonas denitrificans TaxID=43306 RepID=UPI001E629F86|nr:hypothetical protein [Pseudomonas denitrificans (nom. rej.)]
MPPQPPRRRYRRLTVIILSGLIAALTAGAGAALLMVHQHVRQLAHPDAHSELWQAYQLRAELERSLNTARQVLAGKSDSDALATRIEVLASLLPPLRTTPVYRYLVEPRPEVQATLVTIQQLSDAWLQRAPGASRRRRRCWPARCCANCPRCSNPPMNWWWSPTSP